VKAAFLLLCLIEIAVLVFASWILGAILLVATGIAYRALAGERIAG
jgi:hypothetical protein